MGTRSYIVRGLGTAASFDIRVTWGGAADESDRGAPAFHRSGPARADRGQRDLVEVVAELKQVLCVKG
jgi:hypothetical protein